MPLNQKVKKKLDNENWMAENNEHIEKFSQQCLTAIPAFRRVNVSGIMKVAVYEQSWCCNIDWS